MSDYTKGLYNKFIVKRVDGSSAFGGKHHKCNYFVLDLTHDKFAAIAIAEYARACKHEFPALAEDLLKMVGDLPFGVLPRDSNKCPKCGESLVFILDYAHEGAQKEFMSEGVVMQPAYCPICHRTFYISA